VRVELKMVRPEPTLPNEEARLRVSLVPFTDCGILKGY
jgi:hypothetical protein